MATIKDEIIIPIVDVRATFTTVLDVSAYRVGWVEQKLTLVGAPTTPTVDTTITHSIDGTNFYALASAWALAQKTTTGAEIKALPTDAFAKYIKVTVTVGGTGYETLVKTWNGNIKLSMSK
jgi:hypothetical protein